MGQPEIKEYLERHGEATVDELAENLNLHPRSIRQSLKSMEKWGNVRVEKTDKFIQDHYHLVEG